MKFKCECGQNLSADESAIGLMVECPTCKRQQQVPSADAPNVIKPPAAATVPPPPPPPAEEVFEFRAIPEAAEAPPDQAPQPESPRETAQAPLPTADVTPEPGSEEYVGGFAPAAAAAAGGLGNLLVSPGEKKAFKVLMFASVPVLAILLALVVVSFRLFPLATGLVLLFVIGFVTLVAWLAGQFAAAYIRTNAVHVTESQLPELHKIVRRFAEQAGKPAPDVYVLQGSAWNAVAMRFVGARVAVLLSGAVDSLLLKGDMRQVAWLVGHELGHHFAGHLDFGRRFFVNAGRMLPWIVLWYRRQCELTCDRYGLVCSGSTAASMNALANMAAGAQLGPKVDVAAAVEQWMQCRRNFFVQWRTLHSTHPNVMCRIAETVASAGDLNMPV